MSELERNMESFKRLIFRRLENYENMFESRLNELELSRSQSNANEVIELQNVNFNIEMGLKIKEIEEKFKKMENNQIKLEALCSRVDVLEHSKCKDRHVESKVQKSESIYSQEKQVVNKNRRRWSKIKEKTHNYFRAISIPGISKILTTENALFKIAWTTLILAAFALGFWNISLAITDYYDYDKITNIERVKPPNVTFPAITICAYESYNQNYYKNGKFVSSQKISIGPNDIIRIKNFLDFNSTFFYQYRPSAVLNISSYLDFFKMSDDHDCLRFNGVTNKSSGQFSTNKTDDYFKLLLNNFYIENITGNAYNNYSFVNSFKVYITDNYLNSFSSLEPIYLDFNNRYDVDIDKSSIEVKLSEPFNNCKKSSVNEPNHKANCVTMCIYEKIKNEYGCTFPLSLFSVAGLNQCNIQGKGFESLRREFFEGCQKECPESCLSEKFNRDIEKTQTNGSTLFQFSFRDLSTLNITQIPKTDLFTFINNIGGGLGLFMGIAFPNFIEFLQFIFEIIFIAFF